MSSLSLLTISSFFVASSSSTALLLKASRSSASTRRRFCFKLYSWTSRSAFSFSTASNLFSSSEFFFCVSSKSRSLLSFSSCSWLISSSSSASFLLTSITSSFSSSFSSVSMLFWMLSSCTSWSFSWMVPSRRRIVSFKSSMTFCFLAFSFLPLSRVRCVSVIWVCSDTISFLICEVLSFSASKSALSCPFALLAVESFASKLEFLALRESISRSTSSRELSLFSTANCNSAIFFSSGVTRNLRSSLSLVVMEW